MRCPVCGSRNVTKMKTGSYKCNDCGFVFYPDRDAIIDMRDLLDAEDITEEEIENIGEVMTEATDEVGKKIYSEDVKNVFVGNVNLDDIVTRYDEEENVYGVFVEFEDDVSGLILIIIPESEISEIISRYSTGIVQSLKNVGREAFMALRESQGWKSEIKRIDVAYDRVISIMDYLVGEIGRNKNIVMLNYHFIGKERTRGEMIFVPARDSLGMLRRMV